LVTRGYPLNLIDKHLPVSDINFTERKSAEQKRYERYFAFCTQYEPAVPNIKQILMKKWHIIQKKPLLKKSSKIHTSYLLRKLKDMLVRAKIQKFLKCFTPVEIVQPVTVIAKTICISSQNTY